MRFDRHDAAIGHVRLARVLSIMSVFAFASNASLVRVVALRWLSRILRVGPARARICT